MWRLRLLVACLALVIARPTAASIDTADTIVVVATELAAPSSDGHVVALPDAPRARSARSYRTDRSASPTPRLVSPATWVDRKYLRHCALLC